MSIKHPVEVAAVIAQQLAEGIENAVPSVDQLIELVREFERVEFDVPDDPDADGFLFQYGRASWFPEPTFTVEFVRQLEMADLYGEHAGYSQVSFVFAYPMSDQFGSADSHSNWWFRGQGSSFDEWLEAVKDDLIFRTIREMSPTSFRISQEEV